jgi:uncharacterized membrane protein
VKLLGEHEEESNQKIIELEALCKKLREDTLRLEEEKGTLEGMVESRNEMLMEIARETRLDCMGDDEKEEEDVDDGGDVTATPAATPPPPAPPTAAPEEINEEGPAEVIPEQEAPVSHEVVPADAEPMMPQLRLYHALRRDYEENLLRLEDDFDDLDDDPSEGHSDMDEWFPDDGSNDRE